MDEAGIEKKLGTAPLKPYLDRITGIKEKKEGGEVVGQMHRDGIGDFRSRAVPTTTIRR